MTTDGETPEVEEQEEEEAPEVVDVPVRRVEVRITTEDLLTALTEQARTLAEKTSAGEEGAPPPEVAERLQRLADLAGQLKEELTQVGQIDSNVVDRLKRGRKLSE